jgi:hypothetical protein
MTQGQKNFGKAWRERMSALRNLPPVLAIVWRSGPAVVDERTQRYEIRPESGLITQH